MIRRCRGYVGLTYQQGPHDVPDDREHFGPGKSQCRVCYRAYFADWKAGRGTLRQLSSPRTSAGRPVVLDGVKELSELIRQTEYRTILSAVAAHTVFLDPATVAQTQGKALFPIVRDRDMSRRGVLGSLPNGRPVMYDDNTSPTLAFLWSAGRTKGPDVQFNHVWVCSDDPDSYTALWNICATPAFLGKTTDGSNHPDVTAALRYHAFDLYHCKPADEPEPSKPDGYDVLKWAPTPPAVASLETELRERLRSSPRSRLAIAGRQLGWLFSEGLPDTTV